MQNPFTGFYLNFKKTIFRSREKARSGITFFVVLTTILWAFGVPLGVFLPTPVQQAQAAVTLTTDLVDFSASNVKPDPDGIGAGFQWGMTASSGETLTAVTVSLTAGAGFTNSDIAQCFILADTNQAVVDGTEQTDQFWLFDCSIGLNTLTLSATPPENRMNGAGNTYALPSSMTGRGTYELVFSLVLSGSATHGDQVTVSAVAGTTALALSSGNVTNAVYSRVLTADSQGPTVTGAGGPPNSQEFVPPDAVVDRVFNEALLGLMVGPSSVSLKRCTGMEGAGEAAVRAAAACTTLDSTNQCSGVTLSDSNTRISCAHSLLQTNSWYELRIANVTDAGGNALAAAHVNRFKTSGFFGGAGGTNTTPPRVNSTYPQGGDMFFKNANLSVRFPIGPEGDMSFNSDGGLAGSVNAGDLDAFVGGNPAVSLKQVVNFVPTTEVCTSISACVLQWEATPRVLIINPASDLVEGADYELCVRGSPNSLAVKNQVNQNMVGDYCTRFRVDSGATASDSTAPTLRSATLGNPTFPSNGATGVSIYTGELQAFFSEPLNSATVTLTNASLYIDTNSNGVPNDGETVLDSSALNLTYDSAGRAARFSPRTPLIANTRYCFRLTNGLTDPADIVFTASTNQCFTTAASESALVAPKLLFADADNYKIVAHFDQAVNSTQATTAANYTFECPVGVTVPLTGKTFVYRPPEVEIQGLGLQNGQTCRLTVSTNVTNFAGTAMDTTGGNNVANFVVQSSTTTGGFLGTTVADSTNFFGGMGGATAGTFWATPTRCEPRQRSANKATSFECEFPAPGAMLVGSTILLSFPSGFTLSTSAGNARITPASQSQWNSDLNSQESGTVTATASTDTVAKTITLTTAGAAVTSGSMLHFELDQITTPVTAAENQRVTMVVKDASGVKIGQTINPAPFSIQQGGSLSISGRVCKGSTVGGSCGVGDTAIASVKVFCNQMGGFMVGTAGSAFMGFQEATTDASGDWSMTGLTPGEYACNIPPSPTLLADLGGSPPFQPITLSSANRTGVDIRYKNMATATDSKTLTVNISGGSASTEVDVFCSAGGFDFEFSAPSMKAVTLDGTGAGSTTLRLQQNKNYDCGMGPHMAFEQFGTGGPPPLPTFTFMPPKPQIVNMDTDKTIIFAVQASNRSITGTVVDGSATGIANVFVHAEPVGCFDATSGEFKDCHGAFAQTNSNGTFSLAVVDGTYEVGADGPGLPPSTREIANVKGANVTGVTLKMVKSSTTISGAIQDESGNGIQYAQVSAEKRTITTGSDACDFANSRPSGGFADSPTDSSGNFTLYVSNGTWCLRAFSPSYGEVGTKTVTMSGTSLTGQNIAATAANFGTVTGTVTKAGSNVSGAFVNCYGSAGGNGGQTGGNGVYSIRVKLASSGSTTMTCDGFAPGIGPLGRATVTFAQGDTSKTQNFTIAGNAATITVTATGLTEGFCDARDSTGLGSGAPIQSGTATISAPAGTYTVRCGSPRTGPLTLTSSSATLTAGGTAAITATVPTLRTVTGRITDGTSNLEGATATFTDTTTKASFKVVSGNQSGSNNNLSGSNVPEGSYNVKVSKKGFEPAITTASVSGGNLTLSSAIAMTQATGTAGDTVTFPVQTDSAAYTGTAKVICSKDSKTVAVEIDSSTGNASADLANGIWSCKAIGDNGKQSTATNVTVSGGTLSGAAPTFAMDTSISGYTQKSESGTFGLSSGGLMKFNNLAVGSTAPEINVPTNAFSTTDSSTGKVEMKTDPTVVSIDPGADQNMVGSHGYDITPKDANGNKVSDTNSPVTITMPYTDADVTAAGVDESKLTLASYNTSSQTWESVSTTVDTTNNLLIASVSHFSSFGILGGVVTAATVGSSTSDLTPPAAPTNVQLTSNGSSVTLTWTDPSDVDLYRVEVLRNDGGSTPVTGDVRAIVEKGAQRYVDSSVQAGQTYKYIIKVRDTALNQRLTDEYTVAVQAPVAAAPGGAAPAAAPAACIPRRHRRNAACHPSI